MRLAELEAATGEPARNIRYLISEGLIPPPGGSRTAPVYGDQQIEAIRRYQRLKAAGYRLSAIKLMQQQDIPARLEIAPGVTLLLDPALAGAIIDPANLAARVHEVVTQFLRETTIASDHPDPPRANPP